jgi:hypothetical protein
VGLGSTVATETVTNQAKHYKNRSSRKEFAFVSFVARSRAMSIDQDLIHPRESHKIVKEGPSRGSYKICTHHEK